LFKKFDWILHFVYGNGMNFSVACLIVV